jgi:SET domain-containing protein
MITIIDSINRFAKTKLAPSLICDGVGVFALTEIAYGFTLFEDVTPDIAFIPYAIIHNDAVKQHLKSVCNSNTTGIWLSRTYNNINMAYYINHSDVPNVYHDLKLDRYIALRDIQPGEELTCTYTKEEIDWLT